MKTIRELSFEIPIKVVSEANRRDHWAKRFRRQVAQKEMTILMMLNAAKGKKIELPCVVKLTRIGAKALDSDNLAGSFKAVRDSIAGRLAVDDGDVDNVTFEYDQQANGKRDYSVKVEISTPTTYALVAKKAVSMAQNESRQPPRGCFSVKNAKR